MQFRAGICLRGYTLGQAREVEMTGIVLSCVYRSTKNNKQKKPRYRTYIQYETSRVFRFLVSPSN
ncbi:hypothetical protein NADFUDRAFT_81764, partial [Nadsonia fulvescens var. elongata DSM 6958]